MSLGAWIRRACNRWVADDRALANDPLWRHGDAPLLESVLDPAAELRARGDR